MSKPKLNTNGSDPGYFVTSKGKKIELLGVSPMLIQKTQTAGVLPPVPYREVATAFGEPQKEELTEDSLQNDEEKQQWADYIAARDAVLEKRQQNFFRAILAKGIEVDEADLEQWKKEQVEYWEWEIPSNPLDVRVEYVQHELLTTPEELVELILAVMGRSGIPEEAMEETRTMFRGTLRQSSTPPAES